MKIKSYFFTIIALMSLLFIVGCEREDAVVAENGTEVSITAVLSPDAYGVKSQDVPGDGTLINRCILQIFRIENGESVAYGEKLAVSVSGSSVSFDNVSFLPGYDYQLVFWADCSTTGLNDSRYITTGFPIVTYMSNDIPLNDDRCDAFAGLCELKDGDIPKTINVVLTRPLGQINFYATELGQETPYRATLSLDNVVPIGINLLTGELVPNNNPSDERTSGNGIVSSELERTEYGYQLAYCYLFAPSDGQYVSSAGTFNLFDADNNNIAINHITDGIPVRANYRTNLSGDLLGVLGANALEINVNTNNNF